MSNLSAQRIWMSAVAILVIAAAAVGALAGVSHLRSQSATRQPAQSVSASSATPAQTERVRASLSAMPLGFEANKGQTDPQVKYMARGNGYTVFLTANDAVFALHSTAPSASAKESALSPRARKSLRQAEKPVTAAIDMKLIGGNSTPQIAAGAELPGRTNYFIGNDRSKWQSNVRQYETVSYRDVYPGVDMKFHGQQRQLEFDFNVAPRADVRPIQFSISGAKQISTDAQGNLVLASAAGNVLLHKPVAYQEKDKTRQPVDVRFTVAANHTIGFHLGSYDHSRELVIDPSIAYSTYLGGSAEDDVFGIAVDNSGDIYVTGQTASTNFPNLSSYSSSNAGGFDVFVSKFAPDGGSLIYSTYIGGTGNDSGNGLAVDSNGDAFVAGGTSSSDFPTTSGVLLGSLVGSLNAFVLELNPSGTSLTYSTYLGGNGSDVAEGLAIDSSGNAYAVGSTTSSNFPTKNAIQGSLVGQATSGNAFVSKLNPSGTALVYSTYLGGASTVISADVAAAVALDSANNAYVTGSTSDAIPTTSGAFQTTCGGCASNGQPNAFVTVISTTGSLVYSTYLGGTGPDEGLGIAASSAGTAGCSGSSGGCAYVTGYTSSANFPVQSALQSGLAAGATQNAFVTEFNPAGSALVYSTYLGGNQIDAGTNIAVDGNGNAYLTGQTSSSNFPTANATQATIGGDTDAFVSEIKTSGSTLLFSTFLGGPGNENYGINGSPLGSITVNAAGTNFYVAGNTASSANFPLVGAYQNSYGGDTDAFVTKYTGLPDFQIADTALSPSSVAQGGSSTSTVTVTPLNGYTGTVNLSCTVTGSGTPLPQCSFNPATGNSTLTVTTTGASVALHRSTGIFYAMWLPVVGLSLIGMRFSTSTTRRRKLLGFLLLGIVMASLFFLPACGGSSSSGGGGGGGCSGCTPAGSYTVTVTGTDSANSALSHPTPGLTLTVN